MADLDKVTMVGLGGAEHAGVMQPGAMSPKPLHGRPRRNAVFSWLLVSAVCLVAASAMAGTANYAGQNLTGREFRNRSLRKANFRGARLDTVDFEGADLAQAIFYGASGTTTKFRAAKLGGANFHGSTFNHPSFSGATLHGVDFTGATIGDGDFEGANLALVRAKGANFRTSNFSGANLTSAKFPGADLKHTSFIGANLRNVDFTGADLRHANLCNAKIDKRTNFKGADTRGASCYAKLIAERNGSSTAPAPGRWVVTRFRAKTHGYPFPNSFNNDFISEFDVRTSGLCGGMSFSALDYFKKGYRIPGRGYRPATHTKLHDYIYKRQVASLKNDLARWAELKADPTFGLRNKEFFNWGLQGFGGGRLQELRAKIDRGEPAPLALAAYGSRGPGDHQVLAIGYNLGRYKGDLKGHKEDLRIRVYDPSHPGEELTLVPDVAAQKYYYLEHPAKYWRTYFVANYNRVTPPRLRDATYPKDGKVHELIIRFETGSDDLRKGSKFDLEIRLRDGVKRFANVNRRRRWLGNYDQTVAFPLGKGVAASDILSVTVKTALGGGVSGDNWNLDAIRVQGFKDNERSTIYPVGETRVPKVRFTASKRTHTYSLNRPKSRKSRRRRPQPRRPRRRPIRK